MTARDDALAALEDHNWSGARIDTAHPRSITMVVSARLPGDLAEALFAEAEARGIKPGVLVRDLVEQGLTAVRQAAAENVMVIDAALLQTELAQAIRRAQRAA